MLRSVYDGMIAHAVDGWPDETCGLLGGKDGVITHQFRAVNVAENKRVRYEVDGAEIIRILREIEDTGLEHLGIYHSHPNSRGVPSKTDQRLAAYDVVYVVVGFSHGSPTPPAFAFRIHKDDVDSEARVVAEPVDVI